MAFDFLSSMDTTTLFLLLIIFILFVLSMKRVFSIIKNAIFIAVASILFPIVMNSFFGFNIPTDTDSIVSFILLGLGLYFIYMLGKSIYKVLKLGEGAAKKVIPKIDHEKKGKKEKHDDEEDEQYDFKEREKKLEKREKELKQQEREVRFRSAIGAGKPKKKNEDDDYVTLEDTESKPKKSSHVEPLPVIDHKKPKRKSRSGHDD